VILLSRNARVEGNLPRAKNQTASVYTCHSADCSKMGAQQKLWELAELKQARELGEVTITYV
jgi:hypothetical protein